MIEEKHSLEEELEMEAIKQKIEGQKVTEVAPVIQIVTEEEYIEL